MKKITLLLLLIVSSYGFGQQVYIETGRNSSSFEFENNQEESLDNLQSRAFSYVAVGYKHEIFTEGLNISAGLAYNTYGARGSNQEFQSFFEWEIHYLGLNLGLDYELFQLNNFAFFLQAGASAEWMIDGVQTIDNEVINVKSIEEFDDIPLFLRAGGGVRFTVSENMRLYAQYQYGSGLVLDDNNNSATTELKIKVHSVGVGVLVNIPSSEEDPQIETNESQN